MRMRSPLYVMCFTLLVAAPAARLHADDRPKQQAKELAAKAAAEGNDRVKQVQDFCQASALDPKEKKYADNCASYREGLLQDDRAMLASAISAYRNHDLERAEAQAKLVTNFDAKLSGQVKVLLDLIHNQRGQAQAQVLPQVQAAWNKGDFDSVISLSQSITAPDAKAAASQYVNNVNMYRGYMEQAQKLEPSNPQGAIEQLTLAKNLNPNGPGNPAGRIAQLQQAMQTKTAPPPNPTKQPANSGADLTKKVNKLLSDARQAEKDGRQQDALTAYAEVLKLQPGNGEAQSSTDRIQQAIKSDPAAAKSELKAAIRYFYNSQFDDARRALMSYLESPETAKDPGVADFYLGAALVERSILQTPRAQWQGPSKDALLAFQQARKANYSPVRAYVSPALLKIWDSTAQ
ncbi:MAG: hypothetical protein ABSE46_14660 [Terracidiphilus sp.]